MSRIIEPLDASHDRTGFDCGSEPLNVFLQQKARQHNERGVARTFVMVESSAVPPKPILGFFSLSACDAESRDLPPHLAKKLPREIPAARLGRLAVAKTMQGQRIGTVLVYAAMKKIAHTSEDLGIAGLFVDAKDESVAKFYGRFGFLPLPNQPLTLFLPIQSLQQAGTAAGL